MLYFLKSLHRKKLIKSIQQINYIFGIIVFINDNVIII